jgi:hypothetical protein
VVPSEPDLRDLLSPALYEDDAENGTLGSAIFGKQQPIPFPLLADGFTSMTAPLVFLLSPGTHATLPTFAQMISSPSFMATLSGSQSSQCLRLQGYNDTGRARLVQSEQPLHELFSQQQKPGEQRET